MIQYFTFPDVNETKKNPLIYMETFETYCIYFIISDVQSVCSIAEYNLCIYRRSYDCVDKPLSKEFLMSLTSTCDPETLKIPWCCRPEKKGWMHIYVCLMDSKFVLLIRLNTFLTV